MRCPLCNSVSRVSWTKTKRWIKQNGQPVELIRRKRVCLNCKHTFMAHEKVVIEDDRPKMRDGNGPISH